MGKYEGGLYNILFRTSRVCRVWGLRFGVRGSSLGFTVSLGFRAGRG